LFRHILTAAAALVIAGSVSASALAKPQVVRQWTSPPRVGSVLFQLGLLAGHHYSIQISSKGHVRFAAIGQESINFLAKGHAGVLDKSLSFKGTTPYTYVVKQPKGVSPLQWLFEMQITNAVRKSLTVKLLDAG
jgi:hypothetical protein